MITVRAAVPGDLPAVAQLRWRWWDEWRTDGAPDEDPAAFTAASTAWPPSPGHLDIRRGDLQSVYLAPELRGQGWGARLLAHVLDDARARGMQRVTVCSGRRSLSLYERAGFEVTEHLRQVGL